MIEGRLSKQKMAGALETVLLLIKDKGLRSGIATEKTRIFLFCNDTCDKVYSEQPLKQIMKAQLKDFELIREEIKKKTTPEKPVPEPVITYGTEKKEVCTECGKAHATYECDECGEWFGEGSCFLQHRVRHADESQADEEIKEITDREGEIKKHLYTYAIGRLKGMVKSAGYLKPDMSVVFMETKIGTLEWRRLLKEVLDLKSPPPDSPSPSQSTPSTSSEAPVEGSTQI